MCVFTQPIFLVVLHFYSSVFCICITLLPSRYPAFGDSSQTPVSMRSLHQASLANHSICPHLPTTYIYWSYYLHCRYNIHASAPEERAGSREMHRALLMLILCRYMLGIIDVCIMFTYFPVHMYVHFIILFCMCTYWPSNFQVLLLLIDV